MSLSENVLIQYTLSERGQPAMVVPRGPSLSLSLPSECGTPFNILKPLALKMAQAKAKIWP